ncbi:MAG: LamG domain-containing protein [Bacilli bacterium]|nr:LamG domain-containing protein [Bacilli bacterium]
MKRSSSQGFILTETLVVSVILMVVFLFVFSQFLLIFTQYREFESYNKVPHVYNARNMAIFLKEDNYDNIISSLKNNYYFDFTSCPNPIEFTSYCEGLINEMDIKTALLTPYDLQAVISDNPSNFSHRLKQYLKYLQKNKDNPGEYRVILEFNDGTFSSYTIGSEYAYPTKQQYRYRRGYATFNGVTDYIMLPNDLGYRENISVFAWFRHSGNPKGDYHIIFGGQELELSIHSTGYLRTGLFTNARFVSNHGGGLNDGNWHYIGYIFDGTTKKSYIDGKFVGDQSVTGALTYSFANRTIGRYGSSTNYYLNGDLKEIKVYNRALNPVEIINNMNGYNITQEGLLRYYKLSEGKGTTLNDCSGNNHHLTNVTGFSWATEDVFSEWIDGEVPTSMYPVIETRTLYYYEGEWYTELELKFITEDWSEDITTGLIGHWKLDGDANDSSGNNRHCTINGSPFVTTGKIGQSFEFSNSTNKIDCGHISANIDLTKALTISFWAYIFNFPSVRSGVLQTSYGSEFAINISSSGGLQWYQGEHGGQAQPYESISSSKQVFEVGEWVHVVLVRDIKSKTRKIYKNGILDIKLSYTLNVVPATSSYPLLLGYSYVGTMSGKLDDVRIYNRTLSDSEIQYLYLLEN